MTRFVPLTDTIINRPFYHNYPDDGHLLKGKQRLELSEIVASPEELTAGPFKVGSTRVADLYDLAVDKERYHVVLYAPHTGPGNNAIMISPRDLKHPWYAIYLDFAPGSLAYASNRCSYQKSDMLRAVEVIYSRENNQYNPKIFGPLAYVGQREFDGAIVYRCSNNEGLFVTQFTGPVDQTSVPAIIKRTTMSPKRTRVERLLITDLDAADAQWIAGGISLGVGFADTAEFYGKEDCGICEICTGCTLCTECMVLCIDGCQEACTQCIGCKSTCTSNCTSNCEKKTTHIESGDCSVMYTSSDPYQWSELPVTQLEDPLMNFIHHFNTAIRKHNARRVVVSEPREWPRSER